MGASRPGERAAGGAVVFGADSWPPKPHHATDLASGLMVCLSLFGVSSGQGQTSLPALKLDTGKPASSPLLRRCRLRKNSPPYLDAEKACGSAKGKSTLLGAGAVREPTQAQRYGGGGACRARGCPRRSEGPASTHTRLLGWAEDVGGGIVGYRHGPHAASSVSSSGTPTLPLGTRIVRPPRTTGTATART